ncbi:hypothetical protein BJV77DRAFT_1021080, partial [Russula vinacea]
MPFASTSTSSTRPSKSNTLTFISSYRIRYCCLTTVKIFRLPLSSQEMEMIHSQKEREARQITHFLAMFGLQAAPNPLTQVVSSHPYPFPCTPTSPLSPIFPTKRIPITPIFEPPASRASHRFGVLRNDHHIRESTIKADMCLVFQRFREV